MVSWVGYLWSTAGVVLVFGGTLQAFAGMGELMVVLSWAMVALLGVFVAVTGAERVLSDSDTGQRSNPEKALGKVDSRFGRR